MRIDREIRHKLDLLNDEILAAFPQWKGTQRKDGSFENPAFYMKSTGTVVTLTIPDNADVKAVDEVINKHDPNAMTETEKQEEEAKANQEALDKEQFNDEAEIEAEIDKCQTIEDLKPVLKRIAKVAFFSSELNPGVIKVDSTVTTAESGVV